MKKLKSIDKEDIKTICVIDGIEFEPPKTFEQYLNIGGLGIILLVTLPLWIWFYLFGRLFRAIAREKKVIIKYKQLICPICKIPTIKGEYKQAKCINCGWYQYTEDSSFNAVR